MRRFALCGLAATVVAALVFAPQLLTWRYLFGAFAAPQGEGFMQWGRPTLENALNVLFWSKNGLVSWHPIYWVAAVGFGLALWRQPRFAGLLLLGIVWQWYVNTVCADLWAGWSFGNRRFLGISILFAFGMAAALEEALRLGSRVLRKKALAKALPGIALAAAMVPLLVVNVGMTRGVLIGKVRTSNSQDMRGVYRGAVESLVPGLWDRSGLATVANAIWRWVGNPISAPAVAYQRVVNGVPARNFDTLVGDYTLYRFQPDGRPVRTRLDLRSAQLDRHLLAGTRDPDATRSLVKGALEKRQSRAALALPIWLVAEPVTVSLEVETDGTGTVQTLFNGVPQGTLEANGGRQVTRLQVPLELVRWGVNRLEVIGQDTQVGLVRVELGSRY